jgi:predicted O-methyltransferase YrrM
MVTRTKNPIRAAVGHIWRRTRNLKGMRWLERAVTSSLLIPLVADGRITIKEAQSLSAAVASLQTAGPIIEIGSLFGYSTMVMAVAKAPARELLAVDSFVWNPLGLSPESHMKITSANLAAAVADSNVRLIHEDKDTFFKEYKGPRPSLVFLDADHTYEETLKDIRSAIRLGAEVICGHDYCALWPGVVSAVDESGGASVVVESFWILKRG